MKKYVKANVYIEQICSEIEQKCRQAIQDALMSRFHDEDFISDLYNPKYTTAKLDQFYGGEPAIVVEIRFEPEDFYIDYDAFEEEFGYKLKRTPVESLQDLIMRVCDPIVSEYDDDAYFDVYSSGVLVSYIDIESIKNYKERIV